MKLTKAETKLHDEAWSLVRQVEAGRPLTFDEREYVLANWSPSGNHNIGASGSFFTPLDMAHDAMIECIDDCERVLDLCAGTGRLAHARLIHSAARTTPKITCVEMNEEYVRVGRAAVPDAEWVCASMFDQAAIDALGQFDEVISNPPFGKVPKEHRLSGLYNGGKLTYAAIQIGLRVSDFGVFIIPQMDCPFRFSGRQSLEVCPDATYQKFESENGIAIEMNCGIDTTACEGFDRAKVKVEIANVRRLLPTPTRRPIVAREAVSL